MEVMVRLRCHEHLAKPTLGNPSRQVLTTMIVNKDLHRLSFLWCQATQQVVLHQAKPIADITLCYEASRVAWRPPRLAYDLEVPQQRRLTQVFTLQKSAPLHSVIFAHSTEIFGLPHDGHPMQSLFELFADQLRFLG